MSDSMWAKLEKRPVERKPEDIIKEQCEIINDQYSGLISARIRRMDKSLSEYTRAPMASMMETASLLATSRTIDSMLGETDNDKSITYELIITAPRIPSYMYRILFLQHGLAAYPTYLYVEHAISVEFANPLQSPEKIDTERDFLDILTGILSSDRVRDVLSRIISYDET